MLKNMLHPEIRLLKIRKRELSYRRNMMRCRRYRISSLGGEVVIMFIQINIINAVKTIRNINQEIPLLKYKKELENN